VRFIETSLPGAFLLEPERISDERGFFARTWCAEEFRSRGLCTDWVQGSVSYNLRAGTLRGMHYQAAPATEVKLVRCSRGAIFDVLVDLRPDSPRYGSWEAFELTGDNRRQLYIPEGLAHGFQTLTHDVEVAYQISEYYRPELARGVRWNDSALGILWPACGQRVISARDQALPLLQVCTPSC
jgi:dTDP-4-dehydrorhamnose 3,5-epimerase